jgi:uncharacterized protein YndB with AHSA1/START domain
VANDFEVSRHVAADPDAVWAVAGDAGGITAWFAAVREVRVEGDVRTATVANGAVLVERLVDRDDAARRYSYSVVSGIPGLTSHRATIRVEPADGGGSTVHWRQTMTSEVEGYDGEQRLRGVMTDALAALRDIVEERPG